MSAHTQHLTELVGLQALREHLQRHIRSQLHPCDGLLSFYICETAKLLKERGILRSLKDYENNREMLIEHLGGQECRSFRRLLESMEPVSLEAGVETTETSELVNPGVQPTHTTTDTLRRWGRLVAE